MEKSSASVEPPKELPTKGPGQHRRQSFNEDDQAEARPACLNSALQEILFVASVTMAIAMNSILAGSVTVASSFIGRSLDMTTAQITWLYASGSLSSGAFLLFFGMFADLFGRKLIFVASLFLFSVFSLAAGFSKSAIEIDVLIGVMGLCSAAAVPPAVGLLGFIYNRPGKRKNAVFACFSAGNPLGFVVGTILGGVVTSIFNWRASFWLMAIIFLAVTVMAAFSVPHDPTEKAPFTLQTWKQFDLIGTILTVCGVGMLTAALSLGETATDGWDTGYVLALLVVGIVCLLIFVYWEQKFPWPLMPMGIWKDRNFSLVMAILMLGCIAFNQSSYFMALYIQEIWHRSALMTAVMMLPMAVNGTLVNVFAGVFLHRISNKVLMLIGALSYAIANLLFALNRHDSSYWTFCFPGFIFLVVGADLEFNVANMFVMSSMPPSQQSQAGGIFQTVSKLSVAVGFGIATVIFDRGEQSRISSGYWDATTRPYSLVFWMSFACASLSIFLVPFLTIGTQGGRDAHAATGRRPESSGKDALMLSELAAPASMASHQQV